MNASPMNASPSSTRKLPRLTLLVSFSFVSLMVGLGPAPLAAAQPPAAGAAAQPGARAAATPGATKASAAKEAAAEGRKASGGAGAGSPIAALRKTNEELKRLLSRRKPSWSPEAELKSKDVKRIVDNLLDFEELGRRALAKHWDTVKPAQRAEFVNTLRDLVERNYLKQIYGQPEYAITFDEETIEGDEALVKANLAARRKNKKVNVALEYKMVKKQGRWVVYDLVTDELSLLENYRAEFNKIINKDGFPALLARMKKKLNDKG